MQTDDQFARWAALFISAYAEGETGSDEQPAAGHAGRNYPGVTAAAGELLRAVDAGGVPAFVTGGLLQIASDNGIEVTPQWTPNQIVDAIRQKAAGRETAGKAPPD